MNETAALHLSVERVYTFDGDGPLKAFADVAVNDAVLVKGFRVVDGKKGLFVGMPQERSKQGKWFDTIWSPVARIVTCWSVASVPRSTCVWSRAVTVTLSGVEKLLRATVNVTSSGAS